jgi:hypothetical protein
LTIIACGLLGWTNPAGADAVTDWNAITMQTIATGLPAHPGATGVLDSGMVSVAVYDAVVALEGRFRPYHVQIPGAHGSTAAAVAKAAHDVLVHQYPSPATVAALDATYHQYLADHGISETDPGVDVGAQAAAGLIALRSGDGSFPQPPPPPFNGGTDPGMWRPTQSFQPGPPPSFAPMLAPWLGAVTPYTLKSGSQYRAQPPPPLNSQQYTTAYNEAKAMGARFNSSRTAEQTELALFWALNYLPVWNQTVRDLAAAHLPDIADRARLFALVNVAVTDAVITAWDSKIHFVFWRPLTAIREADRDGNPDTELDAAWEPLVNTPNYPDHTSGANNVTGAMTRALALFFGTDEMTFSVTTTNPNAQHPTRTFTRFSDAATEVVVARIWEGIHFRFADEDARKQGRHVAQWAFGHFFRPLDEGDDAQ